MPNIRFIVLNETQAATVRNGGYPNGSELSPRLMDNKAGMLAAAAPYPDWGGTADFYVLNYRVLADADFASVHGYLLALPEAVLDTEIIFLPPEE